MIRAVCVCATVGLLVAVAAAEEAGREAFRSAAGRFAIAFPGTPAETTMPVDGVEKEADVRFNVRRGGVSYDAGFIAYARTLADRLDALDPEAFMKAHRESTVKNTTGEVLSQREVMLAETQRPGYELLIKASPRLVIRQRVFYANGRLYQLMVTGESEQAVTGTQADAFLDSFRLTE